MSYLQMQGERKLDMKNKSLSRYYLFSCIGVLIASYYPLSVGIRVITDMITSGTVMKENYPKYIIPYTDLPCCYCSCSADAGDYETP